MQLNQTPQEIIDYVAQEYPEIEQLIFNANIVCHKYKGSIQPYQAAVLYYLAKDYNHCNILEIGTGVGYSTYFLANACPNAEIVTVNPNENEMNIARNMLLNSGVKNNTTLLQITSREYHEICLGNDWKFDFIFIDGNHKDIVFDLNWYNRLNPDGCIVFHDYSDETSKSPCLPVFNALNEFKNTAGDFDIKVIDTVNRFGMAGWIKK